MPISDTAKAQLKAAVAGERDRLPDHSIFSEPGFLGSISYQEFFTRHLGVTEPEAWQVVRDMGNSYFGHGMDMMPAIAGLGMGLPGLASTSLGSFERLIRGAISWLTEPYIYHFPDGDPASARNCFVTYLRGRSAQRVRAKRVVLACYNMAIPHLCPDLPAVQKEALAKLVKVPMCSTNILLRNWHAVKAQRIGLAYSPGRWNRTIMVEFPVSMDGYHFAATPDDPIMLHCLRGVTGEGRTPEEQSRAGRYELLGMSFDDYEGGQSPHEIGRRPFGRITIANSDAGARAYLDCAIDEAWRAVSELD